MGQMKVAGTVILNEKDGEKKFLVKKKKGQVEFVMTEVDVNYTSLACILNEFKKEVHLDPKRMDLVELTSVSLDSVKIPLFVFSLDAVKENQTIIETDFIWEKPSILRKVFESFKISGVPYLS